MLPKPVAKIQLELRYRTKIKRGEKWFCAACTPRRGAKQAVAPDRKDDTSQHWSSIKTEQNPVNTLIWTRSSTSERIQRDNIPLISIRNYLGLQRDLLFLAPQLQESRSILLKHLQRFLFAVWIQGDFKWKRKGS